MAEENPYGNPLPYGRAPVRLMRPAAFYDGNAFRSSNGRRAPLVAHASNWGRDFFAQVYAATEAADPDLYFYTIPDPTLGARPTQTWLGDPQPAWYSTTSELAERPFMAPGRGFCGDSDEVRAAIDATRAEAANRRPYDAPFELPDDLERRYEVPQVGQPQRLFSVARYHNGLPPAPMPARWRNEPVARLAPGRSQSAFGPAREY